MPCHNSHQKYRVEGGHLGFWRRARGIAKHTHSVHSPSTRLRSPCTHPRSGWVRAKAASGGVSGKMSSMQIFFSVLLFRQEITSCVTRIGCVRLMPQQNITTTVRGILSTRRLDLADARSWRRAACRLWLRGRQCRLSRSGALRPRTSARAGSSL
jgi:hypothetical protein